MLEINKIYLGDCLEVMKQIEDNSVDAVVTDPPYGLEFMGKEWDKFKNSPSWDKRGGNYKEIGDGLNNRISKMPRFNFEPTAFQKFNYGWATECLRVLKHGGYLLSFGGTRTCHRMICAIEDAGFEIRDMIAWVYGSGFPKSLNVGKKIDQLQGNEREKLGRVKRTGKESGTYGQFEGNNMETKGTSEWEGWGTALKPAHEPICMARKPLSEKTVAENVLKYGNGGINIDGCRIGVGAKKWSEPKGGFFHESKDNNAILEDNILGRFPTNFIHDGSDEVLLNFPDVDENELNDIQVQQTLSGGIIEKQMINSSRFFYCAKASKSERNMGCEGIEKKPAYEYGSIKKSEGRTGINTPRTNNHPTVKPIALMEYLVKLVSREGALVLDPFIGSGTTAIACLNLNRKFIGIESSPEYCKIANERLRKELSQTKLELK